MSSRRVFCCAILGSCLLATGCIGAPDDGAVDFEEPSLEPQGGPISGNGFNPPHLWDFGNRTALWQLGMDAVLDGNGVLTPTALSSTAGGIEVLEYTVHCALPEGVDVEDGSGHKFRGALGLAAGWMKDRLSEPEQRWMTACLVQHLNGLGVHVPIMLEGSSPLLVPQPGADTSDYTVKESTMGGNLFVAPNPVDPFVVWACSEKHLTEACGADADLWLSQRICGTSPVCGLTLLGPCQDAPSCFESTTGFWVCDGVSETIRSSLMPGDADQLYEQCNAF